MKIATLLLLFVVIVVLSSVQAAIIETTGQGSNLRQLKSNKQCAKLGDGFVKEKKVQFNEAFQVVEYLNGCARPLCAPDYSEHACSEGDTCKTYFECCGVEITGLNCFCDTQSNQFVCSIPGCAACEVEQVEPIKPIELLP